MKPKTVITVVLLVFVAASVVVLAAKSLRPKPQESGPQPPAAQPPDDGVIAYYFHGNMRCPTCRSIEAYAHEAVKSGFAEDLAEGRLQWRVVNYEEPENEHFATDYELVAPTVVLVEISGGSQKEWKNLPEVWELIGEKPAFIAFVQQNVRAMLEGSGE